MPLIIVHPEKQANAVHKVNTLPTPAPAPAPVPIPPVQPAPVPHVNAAMAEYKHGAQYTLPALGIRPLATGPAGHRHPRLVINGKEKVISRSSAYLLNMLTVD